MVDEILVLDNYDSFTYNLVHLIKDLGCRKVDVFRNDRISLEEISKYKKIVISPGPGIPRNAGVMPELIRRSAPSKSVLGVCLGHQGIAEAFGAKLVNSKEVIHGKASTVTVIKKDETLFKGLPSAFKAGRYHSWMVSRENFPDSLEITAEDEDGCIMAIAHKEYDLRGVQFHPESILTEHGGEILKNWLNN